MVIISAGYCEICGNYRTLTVHHIKKWAVFHDDSSNNKILLCKYCHNHGEFCLEELIRQRENDVLRAMPELYTGALRDYANGVRPQKKCRTKKQSQRLVQR